MRYAEVEGEACGTESVVHDIKKNNDDEDSEWRDRGSRETAVEGPSSFEGEDVETKSLQS